MKNKFKNANEAYVYFLDKLRRYGEPFGDTRALFNVGFTLENPMQFAIHDRERNWSEEYARAEFDWYLSGDPNVDKLGEIYGKVPVIWTKMVDNKNEVRSNYGWQWQRNNQLDKVVKQLEDNPETRQAAISIYDGKEIDTYANDTPCTYAVQFTIIDNRLNMSVLMRSNDIYFGFCNDQYCFARLQIMIAGRLGIDVGTYFHFAHNLHVYNKHL